MSLPVVCRLTSLRRGLPAGVRFVLILCLLGKFGWSQQKSTEGVAVLDDGRVFQGTVEEVPGGYRVQYPGGSSILPYDRISVTSVSLVGAYEAFRDSIQTPNADAHLKLAEWCLLNGLYAQAEMEVQSALRLEPMRSDARAFLKQLDAILRPTTVPATAMTPSSAVPAVPPRAAINAASFTSTDERGPSGLSRQTQLDFMRKIQPLLMNKCGNAGCHGPEVENGLKLRNARADSRGLRLASEHNQAMLFRFIDFERPDLSPLLRKSRETTPAHKNLFSASWQQSQLIMLEDWVAQVAKERGPDGGTEQVRPLRKGEAPSQMTLITPEEAIQQVSGVQPATIPPQSPRQLPQTVSGMPIPAPGTISGVSAKPVSPDPQFLESVRQASRPDAFDPEAFNRQMHRSGVTR